MSNDEFEDDVLENAGVDSKRGTMRFIKFMLNASRIIVAILIFVTFIEFMTGGEFKTIMAILNAPFKTPELTESDFYNGSRLFPSLSSLVYFASYFFIAMHLVKIINSLFDHEIFTFDNVRRLRLLSRIILLTEAGVMVFQFFIQFGLRSFSEYDSFYLVASERIIFVFITVVIAEVFAEGVKLKKEQELTV